MKNDLKFFLEYRVEPQFNAPPYVRKTPVTNLSEADSKVREKIAKPNEYLKFSDFLVRDIASKKIVKVYPKSARQLRKVGATNTRKSRTL